MKGRRKRQTVEWQNGYKGLAVAIIKQATKDYEDNLLRLKRNPKNFEAIKEVKAIEDFMKSDWCMLLMPPKIENGEFLLRIIKEKLGIKD